MDNFGAEVSLEKGKIEFTKSNLDKKRNLRRWSQLKS